MHILSQKTDNYLFLSVKNAHDQSQRKICGRAGVKPVTPWFSDRLAVVARRLSCNVYMSRPMTKPTKYRLCTQRRLGSAWASTLSDQSLRCPHEETLGPQLNIERTAKTDQTWQMPRLSWVFAWHKGHFGVLSWGDSVIQKVHRYLRQWPQK